MLLFVPRYPATERIGDVQARHHTLMKQQGVGNDVSFRGRAGTERDLGQALVAERAQMGDARDDANPASDLRYEGQAPGRV